MAKFKAAYGKYGVKPGLAVLAVLVLCAVLLLPSRPSQAAEWMEPYLEQVSEWGVMLGDASGNLNEDRQITRAEFVVMMNRAFGYTEVGPNPFSDVPDSAWYAQDIAIAHQAGYFNGTSPTTASPGNLVTREQAATLLARCLRLQGTTGAGTKFGDGYTISPTFRGYVQEAAELGIIQGYSDGNFYPREPITRGQVACFLVRALGTLIQEPGEQISGGVYGNLTINTSGVKLKDTTITGNLYLTGGVGLGNVELENVTVMGKIVVCGGGSSEKGENSVVLRNVSAEALEVDSLSGQFLSVKAEGLTDIGTTTVRTSAFLEDVTEDGLGLQIIRLEGESGTQMQLAGNIKEVINLTPASSLDIAQGIAGVVTMDEKAVGATLNIANGASVRELNLDVATPVTGTGSVSHMNINAAGSSTTMLPDTIDVRPGISANVNGTTMDTVAAAESSEDPRLLAGYPQMKNVAPTTADAVFRTNKPGTVYWALTALTDGSVGEETLLNPSSNARVISSGTLNATASNTDLTARQTGLTRDGSYYISAMLVDNRGRRSPVKSVAFTTPDDTTPAFAAGYPYTILTEGSDGEQVIQVMVMPTKDCKLYYALLPNNATAPTTADFRAAAISGNLGFGIVDVKKNVPLLIPRVNSGYLAEQTTYNLYLWLNDADNGKSSGITRLDVTTLDKTPPTIVHITPGETTATSANFTFALDEPGTLYWAVVKQGETFYARISDSTPNGRLPSPEELVAKIQIENGTNALRSGRIATNAAGTNVPFTITGLEGQTRYDLYFVAKDLAGNYNIYTESLTPPLDFSTLDNQSPTVEQAFDGIVTLNPPPNADVQLIFSETVQGVVNRNGEIELRNFLNLYNAIPTAPGPERDAAKEEFGEFLHQHIKLCYRSSRESGEVNVRGTAGVTDDNWTIDYREAVVTLDPEGSGKMIITFPSGTGSDLDGGMTYYFVLTNIADTSPARNRLEGGNVMGEVTLPAFTTIDAQLEFFDGSATGTDPSTGGTLNFDMNFRITPRMAANVSNDVLWDLLFWTNDDISINLYTRVGSGSWTKVNQGDPVAFHPVGDQLVGRSLHTDFLHAGETIVDFEELRNWGTTDREYGIIITHRNGQPRDNTWSGSVTLNLMAVSGNLGNMRTLSNTSLTRDVHDSILASTSFVTPIGTPDEFPRTCPFRDTEPPTFFSNTPAISPLDTGATIDVALSRRNTTYRWVVIPLSRITDTELIDIDGNVTQVVRRGDETAWAMLPKGGIDTPTRWNTNCDVSLVTAPSDEFPNGSGVYNASSTVPITITDRLTARTKYIVYFVLEGESDNSRSGVYAFQFETQPVTRPNLTVAVPSPEGTIDSNGQKTTVYYALLTAGTQTSPFTDLLSTHANSEAWNALTADQKREYGSYTILKAMQEDAPDGSGSCFDVFVDPTSSAARTIVQLLTSPNTGGGVLIRPGQVTLDTNNSYFHREDYTALLNASPNAQYWLVAIGQRDGSSSWAFRAASYLRLIDTTQPRVQGFTTTITQAIPDANGRLQYSGRIALNFDEPLYFRKVLSDPDSRVKVIDKFGVQDENSYRSTISLLPNQDIRFGIYNYAVSTATPDASAPDCYGFTIKFDNCYIGDTLSLQGALCDVNGNIGIPPLSLTLKASAIVGSDPEFDYQNDNVATVWRYVR